MRRIFDLIIGNKAGDSIDALYRLFIFAVFCVVGVLAINLYVNEPEKLGPWGDFFGGVLNPLLTFLTFMGLLITIVLQQTELRESRHEFKRSADALDIQNQSVNRQIFESTFFQMLSLHNTIVNSIRIKDKANIERTGRDCFNVFYTQLSDIYKEKAGTKGAPYSGNELATIEHAFKNFWNLQQRNLGHYYRYLYNVVRFVDESGYQKGPYIRLVRAQLSDQEALMLFYNCLTPQGAKFKALAEKFALFDNMNPQHLLKESHKNFVAPEAF